MTRLVLAIAVLCSLIFAPGALAQAPASPTPDAAHLKAAQRYAAERQGMVSFAVIDSAGGPHGFHSRRRYVSASVTKAMLLVSYLRQARNRPLRAGERALLGPMISRSDNGAATIIYRRLGDDKLRRLARRAGMTDFTVSASWANAHFSARDQARFFSSLESLTPVRHRHHLLRLLSSIVSSQRWGFSRAAHRAGYAIYLKGGWRSTGRGELVHEVALLRRGRGRGRIVLSVLTDGNPSHAYGTQTLRGIARRLLYR